MGCPACSDGRAVFVGCPLIHLDSDLWQLLECAELLGKGLPPVAGGVLDQSGWFLAAAAFVNGEKAMWKAKAMEL